MAPASQVAEQPAQTTMLLTPRDIQRELHVGINRARRMMADGTLPVIRIGQRKRYVPAAALAQWIALQTGRTIS